MQVRSLSSNNIFSVFQHIFEWVINASVVLYFFIAVVVFIAAPLQANQWISNPFLGVFVENTLITNSSGPTVPGVWDAYAQGLRFGSQIKAINGEKVQDIFQLNQMLSQLKTSSQVNLDVVDKNGKGQSYSIELVHFSILDSITYFVLPYLIGLICLVTGIWVYARRHRDAEGRVFLIFSTSVALTVGLLFDTYTNSYLIYLWVFSFSLCSGSLITLTMLIPTEEPLVTRRPIIHWLGYLPSLGLFAYAFPWQYNLTKPFMSADSYLYIQIFTAMVFLIFVSTMIFRFRREASPVIREQLRLVLIGAAVSFFPVTSKIIFTSIRLEIPFSPLLLTPILVFPLSLAYNLSRYRLLRSDYIVRQVLLYSTLSFLAAVGYGFLVTGLTLLFGSISGVDDPFLVGATVFVLAFSFIPIWNRLQRFINATFGRGQEIFRQSLQTFSQDLTQALDVPAINILLRQVLKNSLSPSTIHIYINTPGSGIFSTLPDENKGTTTDLFFPLESGLPNTLAAQRTSIFLGNLQSIPAHLMSEQTRLRLLGAHILVPLPGRDRLIGWISLGARTSGQPYSQRDINFLETLSDQTAMAFERAQVIQDLESRIRQMNVLTRLTQGLNITVSFDDILEFINAQSNQILATRDFKIVLFDDRVGALIYSFFLEDNERVSKQENKPLPQGQGLEEVVINLRRPLVTDNYEHECKARGRLAETTGLYSWIGVPLNTGGDTIGALSLGSRNPAEHYSIEQSNLIQAIADQASGAIVKARLLDEAERRARQMAMLNDVARSMSSTLELAPLFNQILKSAVDILNCTAGSLLLIDQDTGEYIFEAVVGPVANNLVGTRLPPGTGLVGKTVISREANIVNDVHRSEEWPVKPDRNTGFQTNDMLIVPMIYRDDVTGVIEVLNRKDGLPFSKDDQELLSAFVSQAAIALENARLFTLTDQTLAERVDELSVLQRIDRELNTSLIIDRAMRVTLNWAMSQSKADAGLICMIEEDRARIMASEGYGKELSDYQSNGIPLNMASMQQILDGRQPQSIEYNSPSENIPKTLLPGAHQQVIVPIRRETQTIGMILLESRIPGSIAEDRIGFLTRLGDHASIAITNARLYGEVQAANQAKSDFISFVSHELKTPMTSIRGFTDLLASSVVGPVNENQANFLNIIRSNVDRMATLVSDLTDVSRIETGHLRLDFSAISVTEILEEIVRSTRTQILEKKQTLIVNAPSDLPSMWGDRTRLIQVLANLISNAYKYTQSEGLIEVNAEQAENVWTKGSPQVIHIWVKDNGYGISPEHQAKIFQKFYRSDDQKIRDAPGTGLGLNITKQLIELQGGKIWFESGFRVGTSFHFVVPIAEAS